jgi:hypothetical protein
MILSVPLVFISDLHFSAFIHGVGSASLPSVPFYSTASSAVKNLT